jgi:hypothetical protein
LEKLDPNPAKPHFMLKGQELEAKIKQFKIGKLKPKNMLAEELSAVYLLLIKQVEKALKGTSRN